mmetsp:Transcript_2881/g.8968  ORF Transcript_2881/g.8968 Transcript_2881/m.8968 type:complete len:250 (+) Transcript_2881:273-1022(+)
MRLRATARRSLGAWSTSMPSAPRPTWRWAMASPRPWANAPSAATPCPAATSFFTTSEVAAALRSTPLRRTAPRVCRRGGGRTTFTRCCEAPPRPSPWPSAGPASVRRPSLARWRPPPRAAPRPASSTTRLRSGRGSGRRPPASPAGCTSPPSTPPPRMKSRSRSVQRSAGSASPTGRARASGAGPTGPRTEGRTRGARESQMGSCTRPPMARTSTRSVRGSTRQARGTTTFSTCRRQAWRPRSAEISRD